MRPRVCAYSDRVRGRYIYRRRRDERRAQERREMVPMVSCGTDRPPPGVVRRRRKSARDGSTPAIAARSGKKGSKAPPPPPPPPPPGLVESAHTKTLLAGFCIIALFILILFVQTIAGVGSTCAQASSEPAGDKEGKSIVDRVDSILHKPSPKKFHNNDKPVPEAPSAWERTKPPRKVGRKLAENQAPKPAQRIRTTPEMVQTTRAATQSTTATTKAGETTATLPATEDFTTAAPQQLETTTLKIPYTKHPDSMVAFWAGLNIYQIGGSDVYIDIDLSDVKMKEKVYTTVKTKITDVLRSFGFMTSFADIKLVEIVVTPPTWKVKADIYLDATSDAGSLMWFGIPPSGGAPVVSIFEPRYITYLETTLSNLGVVSKVDTFQVNQLLVTKLQQIHQDHTVELRQPSSMIPKEWQITDTTSPHLSTGT